MNFWDRRAAQAENEKTGITVRIDAYPGLAFKVRPLCDWNDDFLLAQVALASRPDVADYLARVAKPGYVQSPEDKALDRSMMRDAFAAGCIVDWSGVPNLPGKKGKHLEFSVENACLLLEKFPDIYAALKREASNMKNFAPADTAGTVEGNS